MTPTTGYVYGRVTDSGYRPLADVTVNVNGQTGTSDANGLYVVEGFGPANYRAPGSTRTSRNRSVVRTAEAGSEPTVVDYPFAANSPRLSNIKITDADEVTLISGTVTESGTGTGVGDVQILVDDDAPLNPNARSSSTVSTNNIYLTGSDGSYTVRIRAKAGGESARVTVDKDGMFFTPDLHTVSAVAGANISGINFTGFDNGTIWGRAVDADSVPLSGAIITGTLVGGDVEDVDTTGATGTYVLSVRYGQYQVAATKAGYTKGEFDGTVNVPNDGKAIADIVLKADDGDASLSSLILSGVTLKRATGTTPRGESVFKSDVTDYIATVNNGVTSTNVSVAPAVTGATWEIYPDDADANTTGHQVDLEVGVTFIEVTVTAADEESEKVYTVEVTRRAPSTVISGTVTDAVTGDGIGAVVITVEGKAPLNTNFGRPTARVLRTGSDGTYEAHVESTGGTALVSVSKTGYTFTADRTVSLQPNSNVTGVDFTGSTYATITGRVIDEDGDAVAGVSVSGTSTGGGNPGTATTNRQGNFSFRVASGTVTITVTKAGYDFPTQTVFVGAGETRSLGNITAGGTIQPTNVEGERGVNAGAFDGNVTVTWMAGGRELAGVTYAVTACVPSDTEMCAADGSTWTSFGTWDERPDGNPAYAGLSVTAAVSVLTDSDNGFMVRVTASHTNPDGDTDTDDEISSTSNPARVAGINVQPSNVTAERDIGVGRFNLTVNWDGDRAGTTTARIIGSFDDGDTWVVLGENVNFGSTDLYTAGEEDDPDHEYTLALAAATGAVVDGDDGIAVTDDDGTADVDESMLDVTNMMLEGKFMIRVQMRHEGVDEDDEDDSANPWKSSASETVNES